MKKILIHKFHCEVLFILLLVNGCVLLQKNGVSSSKQIEELSKKENVTFTPEARSLLTAKYEKEAKKSDFYWIELSRYLEEFKNVYPQKKNITSSDIEEFLSFKVYGGLILKSNPTGANVDFEKYLGIEDTTTYTGSLPVGSYKIKLTKEGCNTKRITVEIIENHTTEITVTLECASEIKMIKPGTKPEQIDKQKF
ncbi:PEGA domain-containing protein [candidate division WOR-3 bacterium]|nr:PEGA domain-containing protein [candidate division WOR-3 bacterium]